jgi:hypothetical protein
MSAPAVKFKCSRCGLEARYVFAEPAGPNRVEAMGDFRALCRVMPQPANAGYCPEFRSEQARIERSRYPLSDA